LGTLNCPCLKSFTCFEPYVNGINLFTFCLIYIYVVVSCVLMEMFVILKSLIKNQVHRVHLQIQF